MSSINLKPNFFAISIRDFCNTSYLLSLFNITAKLSVKATALHIAYHLSMHSAKLHMYK